MVEQHIQGFKFHLLLKIQLCNISKKSSLAKLLQCTKIIIWDEAPVYKQQPIECLDKIIRDINDCDILFGGKVIVLGGDFR